MLRASPLQASPSLVSDGAVCRPVECGLPSPLEPLLLSERGPGRPLRTSPRRPAEGIPFRKETFGISWVTFLSIRSKKISPASFCNRRQWASQPKGSTMEVSILLGDPSEHTVIVDVFFYDMHYTMVGASTGEILDASTRIDGIRTTKTNAWQRFKSGDLFDVCEYLKLVVQHPLYAPKFSAAEVDEIRQKIAAFQRELLRTEAV